MKKSILLLLLLSSMTINAQLTFQLKGLVNDKISSDVPEGKGVELHKIVNDKRGEKAIILLDGNEQEINLNQLEKITFKPTDSKQFWQNQMIQNTVFENIMKNGLQYDLRKDLEEDAIDYIDYINSNNLSFEDSYLESYIYSLVYKIYPNKIDDGRPGIVNVKIIKDLNPNAGIYANGTLIISTGLLSTINSEEELTAVLSHEIAHFVLDHSVININKAEKRKKRAEFWAALATGIAVAADAYVSTNNKNSSYMPGTIAVSGAILSFSIANSINERMGLKFSREQEMEADKSAVELMKFINVNPTALSSALTKIKKYCIVTGNYLSLTGQGTHPAIDDRIAEIGEPASFMSKDYDKKISFVNSVNSNYELKNQHFQETANLVKRNIDAKVATEEDYVLMAMTTLYMYDNQEKNLEALNYINTAKNLNVFPVVEIYKQEAIVLSRLNRMAESKNSLLKYIEILEKQRENLKNVNNETYWLQINQLIAKEIEWSKKMINKVSNM